MDVKDLSIYEKVLIRYFPLFSLFAGSLLFTFIFPIFGDLAGWFNEGLEILPFIAWTAMGAIIGFVLGIIHNRKPELLPKYGRRLAAGFIGWLVFSVMIAALTEEGDLLQRVSASPLFTAWTVLFFMLLAMSPGVLGTMAFKTKKRAYTAGSVLVFFIIALSCMVYSQASSSKIISQDIILSVLFIWSMIAMVESVNWNKRYLDRDPLEFSNSSGGSNAGKLWRRQLSYTQIFLGVASLLSILPFVLPTFFEFDIPGFSDTFESSTMIGRALVAIVLLLPLMLLVAVRRLADAGETENGEEEID
ncbi:MAG: hypothetical protein ACMUIE_04145 [Thermoplasmatota archaeon]